MTEHNHKLLIINYNGLKSDGESMSYGSTFEYVLSTYWKLNRDRTHLVVLNVHLPAESAHLRNTRTSQKHSQLNEIFSPTMHRKR